MRSKLTILLALVAILAMPALAQMEKHQMKHGEPGHGDMKHECSLMMEQHQHAMASMHAMDERMDELLDTMNHATGPARIDAMAAVINELVSQRAAMRETMHEMMPKMMGHMAGHMSGDAKSMHDCPMMKMMHGEEANPHQ